ncbi:MAG TPA: hypothetical protein DCQ87_07755 [Lachnospiraceae bacterium]|nr:hypothetical protein [Lachnospiraceae bacterium]
MFFIAVGYVLKNIDEFVDAITIFLSIPVVCRIQISGLNIGKFVIYYQLFVFENLFYFMRKTGIKFA